MTAGRAVLGRRRTRAAVSYPEAVKRTRDSRILANVVSLVLCGILAGVVVAAAVLAAALIESKAPVEEEEAAVEGAPALEAA